MEGNSPSFFTLLHSLTMSMRTLGGACLTHSYTIESAPPVRSGVHLARKQSSSRRSKSVSVR